MSVASMRRRHAARTPQGGGLTDTSLQDTATDDDVMQGYTGEGPSGLLGDVSIDYDDTYQDQGVPDGTPQPDPYTVEEARHDLSAFDIRPYEGAQTVRDVAQQWNAGVITLAPGADAYLIAGADPLRKRLVIRNVSQPVAVNVSDVLLSEEPSMGQPGSGSFLLPSAVTGAVVANAEVVFTHTGNVFARIADTPGVVTAAARITYYVERYNR